MAASASVLLGDAVDEYLTWLELDRHASRRTVAEYRADLGRFQAFVGEPHRSVGELDRDLLRAYQRQLARVLTGPVGGRHPLAATTRARRLVSLRSFLRFCAREQWLPGDLGANVDVPRLPERLPKPLEAMHRDRLLSGLPGSTLAERRDRALILFLLSTGCRVSEALRLDRLDWRSDRVTVRGKGDRERVVTVTERARRAMESYLASRDDPSPALFIGLAPASRGAATNRLTPRGARHLCHQLAQRTDIPPFHPHQLRHTLGTLLQETVGDARLTAETLGHRGLGSVAGYTKISDSRRRQAYGLMEAAGL